MLPTIATSNAFRYRGAACVSWPWLFDGLATAVEAAALCESCPLVSACLAEALDDHVSGVPVAGVRGGVWFERGAPPRPVRHVEVFA